MIERLDDIERISALTAKGGGKREKGIRIGWVSGSALYPDLVLSPVSPSVTQAPRSRTGESRTGGSTADARRRYVETTIAHPCWMIRSAVATPPKISGNPKAAPTCRRFLRDAGRRRAFAQPLHLALARGCARTRHALMRNLARQPLTGAVTGRRRQVWSGPRHASQGVRDLAPARRRAPRALRR